MKSVTVLVEYKFSVPDEYLTGNLPLQMTSRLHEGVILEKRIGPSSTACIGRQPNSKTVSISISEGN